MDAALCAEAQAYAFGRGVPSCTPVAVLLGLNEMGAASDGATHHTPTTPLWMVLSGHSYRFVREVNAFFPDATRADWTGLLSWVTALPDSSAFAREERQRIFAALVEMFVHTCRDYAKRVVDESFLPDAQRTIKPDLSLTSSVEGRWLRYRQHPQGTVLFLLAEDVQLSNGEWLCGGHAPNNRLAMKIAGHELKVGGPGVSLSLLLF
jgi:hypothetical protein